MSIRVVDNRNMTIGIMALGMQGNAIGSVQQIVHDGDTLNVRPDGNLGVRFLGIDTPEVSFTLPGTNRFLPLTDPRWEEFLSDPFAEKWGPFDRDLPQGLKRHLQSKIGSGVAANDLRHARLAED